METNFVLKIRKYISVILLLAVFVTFMPLCTGTAFAESNNFVENIFICENYNTGTGLKDYSFAKEKTEYDIVFPDSRIASSTVKITIPEDQVNNVYFAILINGVPQTVQSHTSKKQQEIHQLTGTETTFGYYKLFTTTNFPVGEKRDFTVRIGKYNEETKTWGNYDEYTYHVTRSLTLAKNLLGNTQEENRGFGVFAKGKDVSPSFDSTMDAYTSDYTAIIGDAEEIELKLIPTTLNTKIYIGEGEKKTKLQSINKKSGVVQYTFATGKVTIADYKEEDSENAAIPITLEYGDGENKLTRSYTLHTDRKSYPPQITKQPENITINKGENTPLTITAQVPEGVKGELSYQWYKGNNSVTGSKISGATDASYIPPSVYAGTATYCCVVTNTIGKATFTTTSSPATYTVKLNKLTAPEFVNQPLIDGNENGQFYVQNQKPSFSFYLISDSYGNPIEGADYEFKLYRNQNNSKNIEESELVAADARTGSISGSSRQYLITASEAQNITGTWYYFVVLTAKKGDLEPDTVYVPKTNA